MYNEWISLIWEILDIGSDVWVIKKSWAFYSYWEIKLWQWRENSKKFLSENPELVKELEEVIKNSLS
jgi:recombination protein RecA